MSCGGAEAQMLLLGRYLNDHGFDVYVITTADRGEWFDRIAEMGMGSRHIEGRGIRSEMAHAREVGKVLARSEYDVVMLSNSERYAHAALNSFPNEVIVIPWVHNHDGDAYRKALINRKGWNVAVGVGPKVAETMTSMAPDSAVVCITNAVTQPSDEDWMRRNGYALPLKIIHAGRITQRQKNVLALPDIIQACLKRNLNITLSVVGSGADLDELKGKIQSMRLGDVISLEGAVPRDELYSKLLNAHVLLLPSFYEGMPVVPMEAQACGCVPICSRLEGITDAVIDDSETGFLVDVEDIDGFADAIETLCEDPEQWSAMSRAGHEKSMTDFSIDRMGERFMALIRDAIDGRYPLPHPRRKWMTVNPMAFTWREYVPRSVHRLGIGSKLRRVFGLEAKQ
jgi:glycosyltransferase involved in cell wall biosynthesis